MKTTRELNEMAQLHEDHDRDDAATPGSSLVWPLGLVGMMMASFVNVGLFETAEAAGVSFVLKGKPDVFITFQELTTGWREILVTNVFIVTTVPFLIGLALFSVALRRSRTAAVVVFVAGVAFAIATLVYPLGLERTPTPARDLLVRMHLVTGAFFAVAVLPALIVRVRGRS